MWISGFIPEETNSTYTIFIGLPWWISVKESACNAGNPGSIPWLGNSPGGEHSNPLQYSCLENSKDKRGWWATVHGVAKSWTRLKWLSTHHLHGTFSHGSDSKESACNAGDPGLIPRLGRSPREGNGYSSILTCRIPWTERDPVGYSPLDCRVSHDWGHKHAQSL